jgi:hypothetical protein
MSEAVATKSDDAVARPLRVLVPLIKEDLILGRTAAERAGMPHYIDAGEKLLEAKPQMPRGEFQEWVKRNFPLTIRQAQTYMHLARDKRSALRSTSISEFLRENVNPNYNRPPAPPTWQEPVKKIIDRVDTETLNLAREDLKRSEERDAQRALALQLIDIGYKVLARTLHPDKGGSRDAMARLNAVRERLKTHA